MPKFLGLLVLNVIVTMIVIFFIKKFAIQYNVPILKEVAEGV